MGGTTPTIDWGKYQQPSAAPIIDFSKYSGAASANPHAAILQKYGLPESVDLTKDATANTDKLYEGTKPGIEGAQDRFKRLDAFSNAWQEANPHQPDTKGIFASIWDEAKNALGGMFSEGTGTASAPPIPGQGAADIVRGRSQQFKENPVGATARTVTDVGIAALPLLIDQAPEIWSKVSPAKSVEQALGRSLSTTEADAPRPGGKIQPALNNTPREVLEHAKAEGIQLTPGQATEDAMAQNLQKAGTTAAIGGKDLAAALDEQKTRFGQSVNNFMEDVDPSRLGMKPTQAGESIQKSAQDALAARRGKASAAYDQVRATQGNISGDLSSLKELQIARGHEYEAPAVKAALEDISDAPDRVGKSPSVQSMRNLRSEFIEKANDFTGNIPDAARALYKQAAGMIDDQIMAAAKGTPFEGQFRNASALWKDTQQKFNEPGTPFYKILQQRDPTKIVTMLQNAPATDIAAIKAEMPEALAPLRRQVIDDIAKSKFRLGHDGLGGYSDEYLKAVFDPADVKELYLKSDLAHRLHYDPNPAGTGANISSLSQLGFWNQTKMSAAAKLSMPRDPLSFLPPKTAPPTVRTTPFAAPTAVTPMSQLLRTGTNP